MLAKELPRKNLKNTTIKKRNSSNSSKRKELSCRQRRWSSSWLVHGKSGIIERACSRNLLRLKDTHLSKSKLYAIPSGNLQYSLDKLEFPETLTLKINILMQYPISTLEPGAARNMNTQNINQHLRSLGRRRTTTFAFELFDEDNGVFVFVV